LHAKVERGSRALFSPEYQGHQDPAYCSAEGNQNVRPIGRKMRSIADHTANDRAEGCPNGKRKGLSVHSSLSLPRRPITQMAYRLAQAAHRLPKGTLPTSTIAQMLDPLPSSMKPPDKAGFFGPPCP
jgi:hypothetical protein